MKSYLPRGWHGRSAAVAMLVGAGSYLLAPLPALAVAGAVLYVAASAVGPGLALQLVILSTPFHLFTKRLVELPFSPTEFLLLGCAFGWLAREGWLVARRGWPALPRLGRPDWPVLLFLLGAVAATAAAENLGTHLRYLRVVVVEPLALYWLVRRFAREESGFLRLLDALVLAGVAVSVYAVYQYLFTTDTILADGVERARALYGSPNNLGLFLGRVLPICACLAVWGERRRNLYRAALLPIGLALALTFSIGAWIGTGAALLFAAAVAGGRRVALAVGLGLALALAGGALLGLERITAQFSLEAGTLRWRMLVWQAAWDMARDHPFLGIGLDNFLALYPRYMLPEAWPEPGLSHPHNLVLDFWLSTGLIGLLGGLWLLARVWRNALGLWQRGPTPGVRAAGLGLAASTVALVAHGMLDNSYFLIDLALVFWLAQALVAAQHRPCQSGMMEAALATSDEGKEEGRGPGRPRPQLP